MLVCSIAAKGFYFLLDQKVTKNQDSQNASLPLPALYAQSVRTWAAHLLPHLAAQAPCFCNSYNALPPHSPPLFCLIFAETVCLSNSVKILCNPYRRAGPSAAQLWMKTGRMS
jgi:hypothetical protein